MSGHHQRDCIEILIEKARRGQVDRRSFLSAMGVLAALPLALRNEVSWAQGRGLIVVNWGGDALAAFLRAFATSFTKATGIAVRIDGSGPTTGAVRAQAASGRPSWDVVDVEPYTSELLGREGVLAPIDYSVVDRAHVGPGLAQKYGVAGYQFSHVMAWDTEQVGAAGPRSWADFFDVKRFPGKRTLYKWMNGVLEAALLADGVAPESLYPLDVPRALAKLDAFRPHVLAYWGSGAESQQLMIEGEASVGLIWSTRAILLEEDTEGRVKWRYDNGFLQHSNWSVLAKAPAGQAAAMRFIQHATGEREQVELLKLLGNGTTNPKAQAMLTPALRQRDAGSPENLTKQMRLDIEWYVDHYAGTLEKFLGRIGR